ncbi:MAG: glucose-6-phosphate isomerase [Ruminococcaceae bacterium]|nr:glucose-6-phosphate isomerase [Oscillospiraceae bacterium]
MSIKLETKFLKSFIGENEYNSMKPLVEAAHNTLHSPNDWTGWLDLPVNYDRDEFDRIKKAAADIQRMCDVLIVIGIGGSYLGARAAIEFVKGASYNAMAKKTPDVYFSGNSIDPDSLASLIELCKDKDVCINVISKSGTTTEPAISFRIFKEIVEKKYGEAEAKKRIFVTTDKNPATALKALALNEGYETFVVPDNIGGRYSVLTAVGLLTIAAAGCDIDKMMKGAAQARADFAECDIEKNDCYKYAAIRNIMLSKGKTLELYASYKPDMLYTSEWLKQLYGESEGKDNKGLFPASVIYSTDLHSLGQYVQEGRRNIFETVIDVKNSRSDICVPFDEKNTDGLNFLSGKTIHEINRTAFLGTILAHTEGGVPNVVLELDALDEENFGYFVYFFEKACGISGYILGVNPFDQPGVEAYKKNMFALLSKPDKNGANAQRKLELEEKLALLNK